MFKVINLKTIVAGFLLLLFSFLISQTMVQITMANSKVRLNYTIVLDAGHGGVDGGAVGSLNVSEAEINLKVVNYLKDLLSGFGFKVVLTRSNSGGLYSLSAKNKKVSDMENRKKIIEKTNPNMVVSVHMNSFVSSTERGAQTFYNKECEQGKVLAELIQQEFVKNLTNARQNCSFADLFILNCVLAPAVVVEGGFLSNAEEEKLLVTSEYQQKIAYAIFCGILKYFEVVSAM